MKMLQELCAAFLFPSQLPENRYCTNSWTLKPGCWLPFPLLFISFYQLTSLHLFLNFLWGSCKSNCVCPAEFVISADFHRLPDFGSTLTSATVPHTPRSQAMIMQLWRCTGQPQWWCAQLGWCDGVHLRHLSTKKQKARFDSIWLSCCDLNLTKHAFFQANWLRQLQKAGDSDGFSSFGHCISVLQKLQACKPCKAI